MFDKNEEKKNEAFICVLKMVYFYTFLLFFYTFLFGLNKIFAIEMKEGVNNPHQCIISIQRSFILSKFFF